MGYNTTIVVMNDALESIENDSLFGKKMAKAVKQAISNKNQRIDIEAGPYVNAAHVVETHHADQVALITVGGNLGQCHAYFSTQVKENDLELALLKEWAEKLGYTIRPRSEN